METAGGLFQIRPHKDFTPSKGKDRLLSLRLLSDIPLETLEDSATSSLSVTSNSEGPRNAYDFMKRRQDMGADPTLKRWNASIRLANFASADSSPLCVCISTPIVRDALRILIWIIFLFRYHPSVHCLITLLESVQLAILMAKASRALTLEISSRYPCECSLCSIHFVCLTSIPGSIACRSMQTLFCTCYHWDSK